MITTASLKSSTVKDLAELAKSHGLSGWHSMKKDQLIRGLLKFTKKPASKPAARAAKKARVAAAKAKVPSQPRVTAKRVVKSLLRHR